MIKDVEKWKKKYSKKVENKKYIVKLLYYSIGMGIF
jgi:hypothetical protein